MADDVGVRYAAALALLALAVLVPGRVAHAEVLFRFPAVDPEGHLFTTRPIVHVDHDDQPTEERVQCIAYDGSGFPLCYNDHSGTDFLLLFGFATMDERDVQVVAGAAGEVVEAEDGHYDRCHATEGFVVTCDGNPMEANRVRLRHEGGLVSGYWHLKKGSVKVKVGEQVSCGQLLGHVGSSGISATPHLHFELTGPDGKTIDPYAGPRSQPQSYWTRQDGTWGWPGDHCQGQPYPDARVAASDAQAAPSNAGAGRSDGGTGVQPASSAGPGCSVGGASAGAGEGAMLLALAMLHLRRRRRR